MKDIINNEKIFKSELIDTSAAEAELRAERQKFADQAAYAEAELRAERQKFADQAAYEEARRRQEQYEQALSYYANNQDLDVVENQTSKGRTR